MWLLGSHLSGLGKALGGVYFVVLILQVWLTNLSDYWIGLTWTADETGWLLCRSGLAKTALTMGLLHEKGRLLCRSSLARLASAIGLLDWAVGFWAGCCICRLQLSYYLLGFLASWSASYWTMRVWLLVKHLNGLGKATVGVYMPRSYCNLA